MNDFNKNLRPEWIKAACCHVAVVGLSFVMSILIFAKWDRLNGETRTATADVIALWFFVHHAVAIVVGFYFQRISWRSGMIVFAIAFFPGTLVGIGCIRQAYATGY